jgi:tRNA threonylcarbamoyladenosine biosynthesis protein TsaB
MLLLAVETATRRQSVALLDGETSLARADEDAEGSHAKKLLPAIDRVLAGRRVSLQDLGGLAVSIGPGSFTGLRVGLATMLAFRTVTGLPLAAVPTLEAMAWNVRGAGQPVCPMIKGRAGELYWALFRWQGGVLERLEEDRVGDPLTTARSLHEPTIALGDGWEAYGREIVGALAPSAEIQSAPPEAMAASAVSVGLAGLALLARGEVAGAVIAPRYIQEAEATVKALRVRRNAVALDENTGARR